MAENAPPAADYNNPLNKSRGRNTKNNCVKKISGIVGSQCSYTIGITSSFTIGASSSVTVGAALSVTIGGKLSFTSAISFEIAASRTMTITRGTAMTMVYADSYSYQKGAKYAVDSHSSNDFAPEIWKFTDKVKNEVDRVNSNISKSETKTVTEMYTINAQSHELNIDSTETKSVIGSSNEAIQGNKTISSQEVLTLAGRTSVYFGTATSNAFIDDSGFYQTGNTSLGNPPSSDLEAILLDAATQIQSAELALETAKVRAAAAQAAVAQVQVVASSAAVIPAPQVP